MLQPKKTKYRKVFRGRLKGKAIKWSTICFWDYGMKAVTSGYITSSSSYHSILGALAKWNQPAFHIYIEQKAKTARLGSMSNLLFKMSYAFVILKFASLW